MVKKTKEPTEAPRICLNCGTEMVNFRPTIMDRGGPKEVDRYRCPKCNTEDWNE